MKTFGPLQLQMNNDKTDLGDDDLSSMSFEEHIGSMTTIDEYSRSFRLISTQIPNKDEICKVEMCVSYLSEAHGGFFQREFYNQR